ncbi:hypothetical protein JMN32_10110 [Fulvivirga sp. 29W222]|uniref:Uncharacterized protein n=1 Tax=Fulvivirga marina TaxID=2494733 RepID=A0A937G1A4_9BACT|nr:hypothetical protein [Fulvivirga marina]MBL6446666.1 hypothetical protein [Fulvivirga marina]
MINLKTNEEKIFLTAEDYDDEAIKLFLDAEKKISHELFHFLNALYNVQVKAHSLLNYIVKEEMITHEDKEELILYVLNRFFKELILFFVQNHRGTNNLVFFNYTDHDEKIIYYDVYDEIKKRLLPFEDIKKILGKYRYLLVTFCEAYLGLWEIEYNDVINDKRK